MLSSDFSPGVVCRVLMIELLYTWLVLLSAAASGFQFVLRGNRLRIDRKRYEQLISPLQDLQPTRPNNRAPSAQTPSHLKPA